ncbi:hypothetical protein IAT38_007607 [Cryptococcus sp. DSM 104549]
MSAQDNPPPDRLPSPLPSPRDPSVPPGSAAPDDQVPSASHHLAEVIVGTAAPHIAPTLPAPASHSPVGHVEAPPPQSGTAISREEAETERGEEQPIAAGIPLDRPLPVEAEGQQGVRFALTPAEEEGQRSYVGAGGSEERGEFGGVHRHPDEIRDADTRPGMGAGREIGSTRMGASALVSALNALPWEEEEGSEEDEEEDEMGTGAPARGAASVIDARQAQRPKFSRLGSSLHTIRPMSSSPTAIDSPAVGTTTPYANTRSHSHRSLDFPFRENAIARKARRPGTDELDYQFGRAKAGPGARAGAGGAGAAPGETETGGEEGSIPPPRGFERRASETSDTSSMTSSVQAFGGTGQRILSEQIAKEQDRGAAEEGEEILRSTMFGPEGISLAGEGEEIPRSRAFGPEGISLAGEKEDILHSRMFGPEGISLAGKGETRSEANVVAALREGSDDDALSEVMQQNESERRMMRKEKLAKRLMDVFGLEEREEVLEEMKCWLLRSIMLKGYMYLTRQHICFFAKMPNKENLLVKSGPLYKKAAHTKINTKFWVTLKNDVLSWFESTADPYFPKGNISLQYCLTVDAVGETKFKVRTAERNYTFTADTEPGRDEWVKTIKKVMFKTQHEGECIKLIIPLKAVLEVEKSPTLEFAETIEVRCVDSEDQMSVDSYFFAAFADNDLAFNLIKQLIVDRPSSDLPRVASNVTIHAGGDPLQSSYATIRRPREGSTSSGAAGQGVPIGSGLREDAAGGAGSEADSPVPGHAGSPGPTHLPFKKLGSVLRPFISRGSDAEQSETKPSTATAASSGSGGLSIPFLGKAKVSRDSFEAARASGPEEPPEGEGTEEEFEGYPPRQSGPPPASMQEDNKNWGPSWIRKPAAKIFGTSPSGSGFLGRSPGEPEGAGPRMKRGRTNAVTEVMEPALRDDDEEAVEEESDDEAGARGAPGSVGVSRHPSASSPESGLGSTPSGSPHLGDRSRAARLSWTSDASSGSQMIKSKSDFSMLDSSESGQREDVETARKFRAFFALNEKEQLLDHFPGYLYRVLPVSGRFFVSTNYFCFRSSQLLYKTKMIIPIRDLYGLKAQKAFRFGHSGLIVVIKGHEELFLEFSSSSRRRACINLLEERMEALRNAGLGGVGAQSPDSGKGSSRIMEDMDDSLSGEGRSPWPGSPSPLFGSATSASFLEFKPPEPMKVTCLTIGSRGDVQPYIALCKGLQAEGHSCKIATHGEYKEWVEGHGIEFASVGGDPAELMQMCVDNGMFTVSFLKEGLAKFRGWLDDLLNSSWTACQGSDLLIESPSAMGGIHIAEALQIPYYRAFTMPWTRTRAYPHAFSVSDHKRGGSFNYMSYTMFDQIFWRAISGQVNRWRRNVLHLDTTTFDKLEQHKAPFLYNFSPAVVPPPLDWTEWIHVTGYWFLDHSEEKEGENEEKWTPPQELVKFIDDAHAREKKVVYIGFGSIVVSDPEEMTRCVVQAVVESGVCAILSKGWSDRGTKNKGETEGDATGADGVKYPPEIYAIDSIDHGWLFPKIDAACHHGGAGTTGASLRAGIPTIIKPFFGDQSFWAERVESLDVGSAVRKLTCSNLVAALLKATTDQRQIAKAKVVGEIIRKENGVAKAIEAIYRDLEYAKTIIKPLPHPNSPEEKSLDKVTSLLQPLTSNDFVGLHRIRSRTRRSSSASRHKPVSRPMSHEPSHERHASDDGWSMVSGGSRSGDASQAGSPEQRPLAFGMPLGAGKEILRTASLSNPFGRWRSSEDTVKGEQDRVDGDTKAAAA